MKSFNLFDTTSYDTLDELLIEGNNLFKETLRLLQILCKL